MNNTKKTVLIFITSSIFSLFIIVFYTYYNTGGQTQEGKIHFSIDDTITVF